MQILKWLSSFISPLTSVNITERGILHPHISVSKLFHEKIFNIAGLNIIGAKSVISIKISGIFHTTVTLKVSFDFLKIHLISSYTVFVIKNSVFQSRQRYSFSVDWRLKYIFI